MGDTCHLKLNRGKRPIANKYREGKMKSTRKRELKVREIVERETLVIFYEMFVVVYEERLRNVAF